MSHSAGRELVFVLSVSSFTKKGYLGSASFMGRPVDIQFDDEDKGVFLPPEMSKQLGVKEGSKVSVVVEVEGQPMATEAVVSRAVSGARISSAKVYYEVGKEGGAILKIRKA